MRAPQYSRFKPKRASGARKGNERHVTAPVSVQAKPVKITLSLWHKSAKSMGYGDKPCPVMTLPHDRQTVEPARVLCAVPAAPLKRRSERERCYDNRFALAGTQAEKSDFPFMR